MIEPGSMCSCSHRLANPFKAKPRDELLQEYREWLRDRPNLTEDLELLCAEVHAERQHVEHLRETLSLARARIRFLERKLVEARASAERGAGVDQVDDANGATVPGGMNARDRST